MQLNDLLVSAGVDPASVIVLRHRPWESALNKVFPFLAAERPDLFNAFQSAQGERLEAAMQGLSDVGHLASFIAHGPQRALFVGLYKIGRSKPLSYEQFWSKPANQELKRLGFHGFEGDRHSILWFDLVPTDHYVNWKGRLIVDWPPPERSWWRRAHRNTMTLSAILEDSALDGAMKPWNEIVLNWAELQVLPQSWRAKFSEWRAIYLIRDASDGKAYVGSAYGSANLLGRWLNYSASGHGGNRLLRMRQPENFQFSILERLSPDMPTDEVIRLESTWKQRLHTRAPHGLNDN